MGTEWIYVVVSLKFYSIFSFVLIYTFHSKLQLFDNYCGLHILKVVRNKDAKF